MDNLKFKRTMPAVFEQLNAADDPSQILYYQNMISCMLAAPLLFFGAFANLIVVYFLWGNDLTAVLVNSGIFLLLGLIFELISRKKLDSDLFDHLISLSHPIPLSGFYRGPLLPHHWSGGMFGRFCDDYPCHDATENYDALLYRRNDFYLRTLCDLPPAC